MQFGPLCSGSLLFQVTGLFPHQCHFGALSPSPTTLQSNFVPFLNSTSGSSPLSVPLSKILLPSSPFRPQVITHLGRVTFPMTSLPKVLPPCFLYTFHHIPGSVVCLLSYLVPKWSPSHCPHWSMSSLRREIWLSCSALCPAGIGCLDKRTIITQFPSTFLPSVPCLFIFIPMTVVLAHPFPFRLTQLLPKKNHPALFSGPSYMLVSDDSP